jgi:hypothetical protein
MTFDLYLAAFALGRLQPSDLPAAAMQALEEGYDSPAIAALAGTLPSERSPFEIDALWVRGLRDLGKEVPARIEAGHRLKRYLAGLVSSGKLPPRAGALEIISIGDHLSSELPCREYAGDGFGIAELLGIYYSHDDVPPDDDRLHKEIDEELRAECERLVREEPA